MSLLSSVILPALEKQLESATPDVAGFAIQQLGNIAAELMEWVAQKAPAPAAAPSATQQGQ